MSGATLATVVGSLVVCAEVGAANTTTEPAPTTAHNAAPRNT
jgi:hypothetical protein